MKRRLFIQAIITAAAGVALPIAPSEHQMAVGSGLSLEAWLAATAPRLSPR